MIKIRVHIEFLCNRSKFIEYLAELGIKPIIVKDYKDYSFDIKLSNEDANLFKLCYNKKYHWEEI